MSSNNLYNKINDLPNNCVEIVILNPNTKSQSQGKSQLVIIPGFSDSSFECNYKTLFVNYSFKLPTTQFEKILLVKFTNNTVYNLHQEILKLNENTDSDQIAHLENRLYEKCGQIIFDKLVITDSSQTYSVLAKSAGAGPGIFLCNSHPENFIKLNLFAPGVKYIHKSIKRVCEQFPKTIVGWNCTDSKVKLVDVWFKLTDVLPNSTVLHTYYYPDSSSEFDTQNEINTGFFDKIT